MLLLTEALFQPTASGPPDRDIVSVGAKCFRFVTVGAKCHLGSGWDFTSIRTETPSLLMGSGSIDGVLDSGRRSTRKSPHCWCQAPPLRGSNVHAGLHRFRNGGLKCDVYSRRELYAISSCQVARPCSTRRRSVHHSFDVAHVQDHTSDSGICSSSQFAACSCNSASRKLSVRSLCCM